MLDFVNKQNEWNKTAMFLHFQEETVWLKLIMFPSPYANRLSVKMSQLQK